MFATGGLGGVHRDAQETSTSRPTSPPSRPPARGLRRREVDPRRRGHLERLETLNVGVLGYRTDRFPGFYLADSGHDIGWRVKLTKSPWRLCVFRSFL